MLRKRHKCKNEFRILRMFFDNLLSVVAAATTENRLKTKLLVFENGAEKKKKRRCEFIHFLLHSKKLWHCKSP